MTSLYLQSLSAEAKTRYDRKLAVCGLTECPYLLPSRTWRNDPSEWPDIDYGDVYAYLIETPGNWYVIIWKHISSVKLFTSVYMTTYPQKLLLTDPGTDPLNTGVMSWMLIVRAYLAKFLLENNMPHLARWKNSLDDFFIHKKNIKKICE